MLKKKLFSWLKRNKADDVTSNQAQAQESCLSTQEQVSEDPFVADATEEAIDGSELPLAMLKADAETDLSEPAVATSESKPIANMSETSAEDLVVAAENTLESRAPVSIVPETQAVDQENQQTDSVDGDQELASSVVSESVVSTMISDESSVPKLGLFQRLKQGLKKTRLQFTDSFIGLFQQKKIDDDLFEALEEQLLVADVGIDTTARLIRELTLQATRHQLKDATMLYDLFKEHLKDILHTVEKPLDWQAQSKTTRVMLMVGVNGVGKTTTIGKLAKQFQAQGMSVMLAAGDTFRAAAVEQLKVWGERNKIPVIAQPSGSDSASVIFDAFASAQAKGIDVLIADTAGRLQNKAHLMNELKKIVRVLKKINPEAPHEIMLTLDASTGQNAVSQAKLFHEAVGLTGITLSKLDGTAKGGVIFAIADQFKIPIRYVGVGEQIDDLQAFVADAFIEALFQHRSG